MVNRYLIVSISFVVAFLITVSCGKKGFNQEVIDNSNAQGLPVLSLNGADSIAVLLGDTFVDPGASAVSSQGEVVTVFSNTNLNPNLVGDYEVTYIATDAFGNQTRKTRKVSIVIGVRHWLGDWDVDHNCKTITQLNLLNDEANITNFSTILTILHDNVNITGRINNRDIVIQRFIVASLGLNIYEFTGVGKMATDGQSFKVDYTYEGVGGVAGDGDCTATYTLQ